MRYALCCVTYNDHRFLKPFLAQLPSYIEKVLFLVSEKPWNGNSSPEQGKTHEFLRECSDPRVEWVCLPWQTEHEQRSWGLAYLKEYDWVFTLDTDEYFTPEDWERLPTLLEYIHLGTSQAMCDLITYWKDFDHVFDPPDRHQPTIAVRPRRVLFNDKRSTTDKMTKILPVKIHHLSWVRTDEEVWQKVHNYAHALDFDGEKWYNDVWKKWTPEMVGIRPYGVEKDTKAVAGSLPESIRRVF